MLTTLPPVVTEVELENMSAGKDYYLRLAAENKYGLGQYVELAEPIRVKGSKKCELQDGWHRNHLCINL